jgi:hypothetical protein
MERHAPGQSPPRPFRGSLLAHTASSGVRPTTEPRAHRGQRASTTGADRGHPRPPLGERGLDRRRVDVEAGSLGVEAGGVGGAAGRCSLRALDLRARTGRAPLGGPRHLAGRQGGHGRGAGPPAERRRGAHTGRQRGRRRRARRADPSAGRVPLPCVLDTPIKPPRSQTSWSWVSDPDRSDRDVMVDARLPSKMAATGSHRTDLAPQS